MVLCTLRGLMGGLHSGFKGRRDYNFTHRQYTAQGAPRRTQVTQNGCFWTPLQTTY